MKREGGQVRRILFSDILLIIFLSCMKTGEDSVTSSESSSVMWECITELSVDRNEVSTQISIDSGQFLKGPKQLESVDAAEPQRLPARSEEQIRDRYFQKLQRNGLLPEKPRKKSHHLIVFDWDDTLFCTSFMQNLLENEWSRAGSWEKEKVEEIDRVAAETLELALTMGEVCIVTNSVEGWVDYCSRAFMSLTHDVIVAKMIPVVSARDASEREFPSDPQRWKTEAFRNLLAEVKNEALVNVISVGDSNYEIEAAEQATRRFGRRFVKTIKLREKPRAQQLLKQLKLISSRLSEVFSSPKSLTIRLQPKQ